MDSPAGAMAEVAEEDGSSRKPCDHSSEMLEQIIQDVIRDHSVQGPEKEQAETFTRNVCLAEVQVLGWMRVHGMGGKNMKQLRHGRSSRREILGV